MNRGSFLAIRDIDAEELQDLLALAERLEEKPNLHASASVGEAVALVFEKPSLRTKSSFSVGAARLGMLPVYLSREEIGLGKRESVADAAGNLSQWYRLIVHRTFEHERVVEMAARASVPVINALSDFEHPCQALADLQTLRQRFGRLEGLRLAYLGDGNNVAHSLMGACALAGVELTLATPSSHAPDAGAMASAQEIAGARVQWTERAEEAVAGAHAVYTDTWISMGQEEEAAARRKVFADFRVDAEMMARARPDAVFLHCLPAHRGEEVTDEVMDSPASMVLAQAKHRLYTQQALMIRLLDL